MPRRLLPLALLAALCACGTQPPLPEWPAGSPAQTGMARGHADPTPISASALLDQLTGSELIILGEQHDNPHHHALERWTIEALARRGKLGAVVMEMLDAEQQPALDHLAASRPLPDEARVKEALQWPQRKWPWADYGPLIMEALRQGVPLYAGQPPVTVLQQARQRQDLPPLPPQAIAILSSALREGHCGLLPEQRLPAMLWVQYRRDEQMARTLERLRQPGKQVLLITGNGHARRDSGVPLHLAHPATATSISLGPPTQEAPGPEYDWLWFGPTGMGDNHCDALKRQLNSRNPSR